MNESNEPIGHQNYCKNCKDGRLGLQDPGNMCDFCKSIQFQERKKK